MVINRGNWVLAGILIFSACLLTGFCALALAQVPDVGPTRCVGGPCEEESRPSAPTSTYVPPAGPSPQELKRQREEKDLGEAAQDAVDRGDRAYQNGNYDDAVKYYTEALSYSPDDPDIKHYLERSREALRQSRAARELKSSVFHGEVSKSLKGDEASSAEAKRVFDTGGKNRGGIEAPAVQAGGSGGYRDPVVPASKRTLDITMTEWKREFLKWQINNLEKERQKLDPVKDAVKISKIKQEESNKTNEVHMLNFSIGEKLRKAEEPKAQPAKKSQ